MPNRVTLALKINKALIAALWKSVKSFMTKCSDNKTSILPRAQKFSLDKGINGALLVEVFSIRTFRVCSTRFGIKNAQPIISMSENYNLNPAKSTHFALWITNRKIV